MDPEPRRLGLHVLTETGLACDVSHGLDQHGNHWYLLRPSGHPADHAFAIRTTLRWRSVIIDFEPGKFAGELVSAMGAADDVGRSAFRAILGECSNRGAILDFRVNGSPVDPDIGMDWPAHWKQVSISLRRRLEPASDGNPPEFDAALAWTGRFAAAILALLPVQDGDDEELPGASGYEEGGASIQRVTRYERDRRNRAAAIAIWGSHCQACGLDFGGRYGEVAAGFIEVHHITPVSVLDPDTVVDPARDLVPLCPNCHAVAHRRDPPFSVDEIQTMLQRDSAETDN